METLEAIRTRRSIRKFEERIVPWQMEDQILRAAMAAPSAGNQQSWEFVVVRDRKMLNAIPTVHPYAAMCPSAALVIVVCGVPVRERHRDFWVQDCSAAMQNLLLAVHDLGLGAVWLGLYPRVDRVAGVRQLLGIPDSIIPMCMAAIGHPAETHPPQDRFDATRVHLDRW